MRLYGMQTAFKALVEVPPSWTFTDDEMTDCLIQSEWDDRRHRSV